MTRFLATLLYLSAAGSLMGLLLVLARKALKTRIPVMFWHAAWILVFLRFVLPVPGLVPDPALSVQDSGYTESVSAEQREHAASEAVIAADPVSYNTKAETAALATVRGNAALSETQPVKQPAAEPANTVSLKTVLKNPALWFALWLTGAVVSLIWQMAGYVRFLSLLRPSFSPVSGEAEAVWDSVEGPKPELLESPGIRTPMLVGFLHPKVLLPEGLALGDSTRMILDHELTHFRHGDLYVKWFTVLVSSIHWFNPVMRLFRPELDRVIELNCDAHVLRSLTSAGRKAYGEALLNVAALRPLSCQLLSVSFVTEKRNLKERLVQIMKYRIPKKSILILLALVLLVFVGCLAATGPAAEAPSAPPPLAIESASAPAEAPSEPTIQKTSLVFGDKPAASNAVYVSDVDSFLKAIRTDAEIVLEPGVYDLTAAKDYASAKTDSPWYIWSEVYDGYELTLTNVANLTIRSSTGNPLDVSIETRPRYANVLFLDNCSNVTISDITAGHTREAGLGECNGGVIYLRQCSNIGLSDCSLYGCGVIAVSADNCNGIRVLDSDLYECSWGAVYLSSSTNVNISGCTLRDCGEVTDDPYSQLIEVYSCYGVAFTECAVYGNRTATVLCSDYSQEVYFIGNSVDHPAIGSSSAVLRISGSPVIIDRCCFTGTAEIYAENSEKAQSRDRTVLSEFDLASMQQGPSDFDGFRTFDLPEVTELTPEEAAALPLPESAKGKRTVKVTNVDEFLAAIAPETVIYLEAGTYNLASASGYGAVTTPYFEWQNPYDGPGLVLSGVYGLQIVGAGKDKTSIVAEPRYVDVLSFENCNDILLSGFTAGHTAEPGECMGGVLMFRSCDGIDVEDCGLFGCGIMGITGWDSEYMTVKNCEIYSCSLGAVDLESCIDCTFEGNSIHDCAYPTFLLYSSKNVVVDGKKLSPNEQINLPGAGPYKKVA